MDKYALLNYLGAAYWGRPIYHGDRLWKWELFERQDRVPLPTPLLVSPNAVTYGPRLPEVDDAPVLQVVTNIVF